MADVFSKAKRSDIMRGIRSTDTLPEMRVRKKLHGLGFRYRLHDRSLPGKPDIVMPKRNAVIQVRGCFWHSHACSDGRTPRSNQEYWKGKLGRNRLRDEHNDAQLRHLGWRLFVVWECEVHSDRALAETVETLRRELAGPSS